MRHKCAYRKLGRTTAGRRQLFQNQITSLILNERIISTLPKVKELRRVAERTITRAKHSSQQGLLKLSSFLHKEDVLQKLCGPIVERYRNRTGGYTRIMRIGYRERDKAPLGMIELVDSPFEYKKALAFWENEKNEKNLPFCHHPPIPRPSNNQRTKMAKKGLLPKTHNCYDYPPVAKQYLIDHLGHLRLKNTNIQELKEERNAYVDSKIMEIYKRECEPKYKPGWSLPMASPSSLQSVINDLSRSISTIRPKISK